LDQLTLPAILNLPDKLYPIVERLDNYRYFLLEGGRGGGKSHTVGRFLLYLGEIYNLRCVCGRETQNSINESVYSLLKDLITEHQLQYEVQASQIRHRKKKTDINFRGFRQQGAFNLQGMEGVDFLWIDEAQAITKKTLDVLIPTIRKDQSKIFFTMNRHVVNDPVYTFLKNRPDCLHIPINYFENQFCTNALKKEADYCKQISEKDYRHIWLGEPLDMAEDAVFSYEELQRSKQTFLLKDGYGIRIAGYDIARYGDDKCAVVILEQMGALHWQVIHFDQWDKRDLNYTTGRILSTSMEYEVTHSIIDEDGLGGGPLDTLTKGRGLDSFSGFRNPAVSYKEDKEYANPRTKNAYKLKDLLMKGHISIPEDMHEELMSIKYSFDCSKLLK